MRKKIFCSIFCMLVLVTGVFSQKLLFRMMSGFNDLSESVVKFFTTNNGVDSTINSVKAKKMADRLLVNINSLILAKKSIVLILESDKSRNPDYGQYVGSIQIELQKLRLTLSDYKDLIEASGIDVIQLDMSLKNDFLIKASTLQNARSLMSDDSISDAELRKNIIVYFKSCINFLESAKLTIVKFRS